MAQATMIDIKTELTAIEQGQCAHCRIGATHQPDEACYKHRENYKPMKYCGKCNYLYVANFPKCPVCNMSKN